METRTRMMRPLEDRFPQLYWNLVTPASPSGTPGNDKPPAITPRSSPPTMMEVVKLICEVHGVQDGSLSGDLAASMKIFLGV